MGFVLDGQPSTPSVATSAATSRKPAIRYSSEYGAENPRMTASAVGNATVTSLPGSVLLDSGTAPGQFASYLSRNRLRYNGADATIIVVSKFPFSSDFQSTAFAGGGTPTDSISFARVGPLFGTFIRSRGSAELQTFQVTSPQTTPGIITVTLDGVPYPVNVSGAVDNDGTAEQLGRALYPGWLVRAVGDTVYYFSLSPNPRPGLYAFTATEAAGTFTQVTEGASSFDRFDTSQTWNRDRLDGTGPSNKTLDPTAINRYEIEWSWCCGLLNFYVQLDGIRILVHSLAIASISAFEPIWRLPSFGIGWIVSNLATANPIQLQGYEATGFNAIDDSDPPRGKTISGEALSVGTALTPILSIRVPDSYKGVANELLSLINSVSATFDGGKPAYIVLVLGGQLDLANWQFVSEDPVETDTAATTIVGGEEIATKLALKIDSVELEDVITLAAGEQLTVAVRATSGTTDVTASINWTTS